MNLTIGRSWAVWPEKNRQMSKKLPKTILLVKWTNEQIYKYCLKCVGSFGKIIAATGFEKLAKVQKIAKSGHTGREKH